MLKQKMILCLLSTVLCVFTAEAQANAKQYELKGKIIDNRSKKGISQIPMFIKPFNKKIDANKQGEFLFKFRKGEYTFIVDFYPFKKKEIKIDLQSDTTLIIELFSDAGSIYIPEVEVFSNKLISKLSTGIEQIDRKTLQVLPALIGERDILKALAQSAGISSSSEGAADLQVRGGTHGQNLYLLDGVSLYSTEHFFGLVSAYNPLIIKSAKLYKSGFPAAYGGKVSSVVDVLTEDADLDKLLGSFDISLLSSKLYLNLPVIKNKLSFAISGRISNYSLVNLSSLLGNTAENAKYNLYFGDINANLYWKLSDNDQIKITWFNNSDGFEITNKESLYITDSWIKNAQQNIGVNWYHTLSKRTQNHFMAYFDQYTFNYGMSNVELNEKVKNICEMISGINSIGISEKLTSSITHKLKLNSGISVKSIGFMPFMQQITDKTINQIETTSLIRLSEIVAFSELGWAFSPNHQLSTGLRLSVTGNTDYQFYDLEPRVNYLGKFNNNFSINASVDKLNQPIHRLANPGLGMPIELFLPSGSNLNPQTSWNYSFGVAKDFAKKNNTVSFKADIWYKTFQNITEFKDGIDALSVMYYKLDIANYPNEYVTQGKGKAYGIDLMGSISNKRWTLSSYYTLMQAINQFDDLNFGKPYAASTDIRHLFNITFKRNFSSKFTMVLTWQYNSGKPITVPTRLFQYPVLNIFNGELSNNYVRFLAIEDKRNNYRTRPFHKLDISFTKEYQAFRKHDAVFSFGVYNAYNQANPYIYYLSRKWDSEGTYKPVLKSMQMFPILPSASWSMKF
ncbi:MAG: carboxypeptidase-like regulatory domain-containing protein [Paludibacter sp.]|nr:carboxypeptidase-like regulatory domain-containing protein [Paludibacter sp.]